jgi:hypothetical protein
MLIAKAERTDLLHLGVRQWETEHTEMVPSLTKEGCILVWSNEVSSSIPDLVVVADGGIESFLAWTATYIPHLAPITALSQVVEHASFVAERTNGSVRSKPPIGGATFERGCLGLLHGEVVAACNGASAPLHIGLTPYISTFSWLAIQHQYARATQGSLCKLRENWDEARRLLEAPHFSYVSDHVEEVWSLITEVDVGGSKKQNQEGREVREFLQSVKEGTPSPGVISVAKDHVDILDALKSGPLEGRVEAFRKLVQTVYKRRSVSASYAMLAGFAVSQISQGTFAHIGLLGPGRVSDARPLLWYGWFDFSRHNLEAASPAVSSASLQLLQHLRAPRSPLPRRDVSIEELRVLARQKTPFADCLLDLRHPLGVEIATGAVVLIQPGLRGSDGRTRHLQRSLFDAD